MKDLAVEIIRNHWKELKKKKNVVGFSSVLSPRIKDGQEYPNEKVFRIYVSKKLPKDQLKARDLVPECMSVQGESILTDVVEIGEINALSDPTKKYRPIVSGISTMHKSGTACTMNCFYKDKSTGKTLVSSNNHCYAMENSALIGDEVMQPSPHDNGVFPFDVIGTLDKYVEIKFNEFKCPYRNFFHNIFRKITKREVANKVDIAFALINPGIEYEISVLGGKKVEGKTLPNVGDILWKIGRTTGYTEGPVVDLNYTGLVGYSRGTALFTDCILVGQEGFSAGGDSGSPVFKGSDYVGALFAGSDTTTVICKVSNIELEAGVELITS